MEEKQLYIPSEDEYFADPYIDVEEWRDAPVRHYFVHGGFRGTEEQGMKAKFCFYFPEKEKYEGRFYQYLSPAPEDEHESETLTGEDDKISFALTHGAYYVVSNQGGIIGDGTRLYRTSANSAEFSRKVAKRLYETEDRPYGYVFGGSGGSFKTMSCMEMTEGVWDGAVPYVLANPMATPNVFCPRTRAMRILGEDGMAKVLDNMEPGGSGNIYDGLNEEQKEALEEATKMGFPKRGWFSYKTMGDGALMVLMPHMYQVFPQYFEDFWTKEGYAGTDPNSSEYKSRVQFKTKVKALEEPVKRNTEGEFTSVDNSWQNVLFANMKTPNVVLEELPPADAYLTHCRLKVVSGEAAGCETAVSEIREDHTVVVDTAMRQGNVLEGIAVGDEVMIDNSDYLAMQTLQRHQVPDASYKVYDQYRKEDGTPKYQQLPFLISPQIARGGGGSLQSGHIHGKMIVCCSLLDECAYAWHGDWYRQLIRSVRGGDETDVFRLYYNDNCIHDDRAGYLDDPQHQVDYLGILHQALLDVADWAEKGIAPVPTTNYTFDDGQTLVPDDANERGGLQPVVHAYANGEKCVHVKVGEEVTFTAEITVPHGTGKVTEAAWDYEKTNDFSHAEKLELSADGEVAKVTSTHTFAKPGTYFPVIKVKSNRHGDLSDIFTQCKNLDRVRVIVEE